MSQLVYLLGFASGSTECGKDTATRYLVEEYGFERLAFGDALRQEVQVCLDHAGPAPADLPGELAELLIVAKRNMRPACWDVWEKPTPPLLRRILQLWGTEYRRQQYRPDYWIRQVEDRIEEGHCYAISDLRFPEGEGQLIKRHGGFVGYIHNAAAEERGRQSGSSRHASEAYPEAEADFHLDNDRDLLWLYRQLDDRIGHDVQQHPFLSHFLHHRGSRSGQFRSDRAAGMV